MMHEWPRRTKGKLVQSPGGPIQGSDYTTTARSVQPPFPSVGDAIDFPALGITSQENWAEYPRAWEQGGLYLRPQASDGTVYLIASRVRPCSEYPDRPNSRDYVETLHAAHPIASLDFPSLFQLPEKLVAVSLTELDRAFPPLKLDGRSEVPLPRGWFADSRAMLVALVAGIPLDSHDYALPVGEFFDRALRAVACLPGTIRWRVPIASGVYAVPTPEKAGVRYALALAFKSRGSAGPIAESPGEAYALWFEEATEAGGLCETVDEILEVVENRFPLLTSWDAMSAVDGWEVAVKALAEIQRFEALKVWVRTQDGPAPDFGSFHHLRTDVLDVAARSLDGPAVARDVLLSGVLGSDWKSAWEKFASPPGGLPTQMAIVGQLLGILVPLDLASVARVLDEKPVDLPDSFRGGVQSRLSAALDAATSEASLADWEGLLRRAFRSRSPAWFADWVGANASKVLWRAVRLRFLGREIDSTSSWDPKEFPGRPAAVQALLKRRRPQDSDFRELLDEISDADAVSRLVEHISETLPVLAIRLALAAGINHWLSAWIRREVIENKKEGSIRALAEVGGSWPQFDRRLAEGLISAWGLLTQTEQKSLRPRLRPILGSLDSILFGNNPELTTESVADWVWPIARTLCEADARRRRNVLLVASQQPDLVILTPAFQDQLLKPILGSVDIASVAPESCLSLQFALTIRDDRAIAYPAVQGRDLDAALLWLPLFSGLRKPSRAPVLQRLDQLPIAIRYGSFLQPSPPTVDRTFWVEWLRMIDTDQRSRYLELVKNIGNENKAFWRFAAGWGGIDGRLFISEVEIIENLDLFEDYLRAVLRGAPLRSEIARRINCRRIPMVCATPEDCENLYNTCKDIEYEMAAVEFWKHCLRMMNGTDREQLHRAVGRGRLGKLWDDLTRRVLGRHEASEGWLRLALLLYESSSDYRKGELNDAIRERMGP